MINNPIGVFDSGLGGLTVLKEIMDILPNENIIYFGDTARVPYGPRSKETVIKYTFQAINFLLTKNVKAIVIACNTATATSLVVAQQHYNMPIVGVIEAGARTAVEMTKNNKVGVIGTEGTINSKAYEQEIHKLNSSIQILGKSCPLFVPIAEEGWSDTEVAYLTAMRYLQELKDSNIDSLVLGCTHYPLLINTISKVMGDKVTLVNPARETAKDLLNILSDKNLLREEKAEPDYSYYVSDAPNKFSYIGQGFLNKNIENIYQIEIQKY